MQPKLLGAAPAIVEQHFAKSFQGRAWPPVNYQFGIIEQLGAPLLQFVHQRVFLVRVKRFIETAELIQRISAGKEIAKDQYLFAAGSHPAYGLITRPAGAKGNPTPQGD